MFLDFTDLLISLKTLAILGAGRKISFEEAAGQEWKEPRADLEQQNEKGHKGMDFTSYARDIN